MWNPAPELKEEEERGAGWRRSSELLSLDEEGGRECEAAVVEEGEDEGEKVAVTVEEVRRWPESARDGGGIKGVGGT